MKWEKNIGTFKDDYEFIFATPMAKKPTLDINGESLSMQAGEKLGIASVKEKIYKDPTNYRQKNTKLVDRREKEIKHFIRFTWKTACIAKFE
ncbi:hypothetical protein GS885_28655 [Rhodococcus hoagii]|nr:hypothetical protein [Prescottella equi]